MILMKTMNNFITGDNKTNLSLQKLVDDLIGKTSTNATVNKSAIRNTISPDLYINMNEDIVASVIEGMLTSMMANGTDGVIDITAKELFSNTIKLSVKDNNCYNTYAVACSLQNLVPQAERIGGFLNITNQRQKITTIEFSFPVVKDENRQNEDDS
jgi:hypothetical protein